MALINQNNPRRCLRPGITTGSCAALAARAATVLLFSGEAPEDVSITLPNGASVSATALHPEALANGARCAVKKDAGDDPDVTDGMLVYAEVRKNPGKTIFIDGGAGVGRITKKGLDQPVGAAAINSVPRKMIQTEVANICMHYGWTEGMEVIISIPGGVEMAVRTFNPRLGIEGGLSILGTTGIVEPMSSQALIDTIAVELRVVKADGWDSVILTPGNFGNAFVRAMPELAGRPLVKISNFFGDSLDAAGSTGFSQVLLVAHLGKCIKLAGGIFNTHSQYADCRLEFLALHAGLAGADSACMRELLGAATVESGWDIVTATGLDRPVMDSLLMAIEKRVAQRVGGRFACGIVVFDNQHGLLGQTECARALIKEWHGE